jgi:fermentation-respiration switch protein FrsA (DUF1100 family)
MAPLFDDPGFNETLFFPRPDPSPAPPGARDLFVDVEDARVHVRRHDADDADLSLLFFHGNGEIVSDYDALAERYAGLGAELVAAEYRGYGKSTGSPSLAVLLGDAGAVLERLRDQGLLRERLVVMGRSLGSVPAVELASSATGVAGLIVESGFAEPAGLLERRGIPVDVLTDEEDRLFNNRAKMTRVGCPTLVLHGAMDMLIPPMEGAALHEACAAEVKRLVVLDGVGHNDILWGAAERYFSEIERVFLEVRACARGG